MVEQIPKPLPLTIDECRHRGWQDLDIVLVNGDAYVDHPSFGIAIIGRLLEARGYRVAILAQPDITNVSSFKRFGRPRLFFGISGGNLDSIVANYSGNGKVRDTDAFSPAGSPWRSSIRSKETRYRPDRAVLVYANLARQAYPGITIVLGGVEASLRRFIHYDYQQQRLRGSHLTDAKGDLLIYGMAEQAVVEAADRIAAGHSLEAIPGTCLRGNDETIEQLRRQADDAGTVVKILPSWQDIARDKTLFMAAEKTIDRHARAGDQTILLQHQQAAWLIHYPPAPPLTPEQLDDLYLLPFSRLPHPLTPDIPAFDMVKDSITIVRGCCGNCSFCAISRHQGPAVVSRSIDSILSEISALTGSGTFNGTVSDLGGPTANLYGTSCAIGSCSRHDCLFPSICKHLLVDEPRFLELLKRVQQLDRVKHVFVSSGLRLELLLKTPALLEKIIREHTPGALKIAPEHTDDEVLQVMHKESFVHLERFVERFRTLTRIHATRVGLTPYIISAHPGCDDSQTLEMIKRLKKLGLTVRSFQDFTPTPGTMATAMYVTGIHRDTGAPITVARNRSERLRQRRLIERAFLQRQQGASAGRTDRTDKPVHASTRRRGRDKRRTKR